MNKVTQLIESIAAGKSLDIERLFESILAEKVAAALSEKRMEVAKNLFAEGKDEDEDEDEGEDEDEDEDESDKKINELSKDTLKSYIKGASRQATTHSEIAGNYRETADKIRDLPGSKHFVKHRSIQ